jgi:hypothetical protein
MGEADLVIGSRALGNRERGAMTVQQVFGNWLATRMLRLFYGAEIYRPPAPFGLSGWDKNYYHFR